jgi:hypothetical protein
MGLSTPQLENPHQLGASRHAFLVAVDRCGRGETFLSIHDNLRHNPTDMCFTMFMNVLKGFFEISEPLKGLRYEHERYLVG